ncbi:MAG: hemerythrin domain-containing protein [Alphaproteobacteria bacterium]|nr:hemerythrin domain-containing protein [Alphaproteobacteria bacterium]
MPSRCGRPRSAADAGHRLEERILFPDFDKNAGSCFAAMMIERLKAEHRCDGLACEEMVETLKTMAEGRCPLPPETVRYMLRGFLEGLRRHVSSERLMIETLLAAKAERREVFA